MMTESMKLDKLSIMSDETDENILLVYLSIAGEKILNRLYPYCLNIKIVPEKYELLQLEIACYLINKIGSEGQVGHGENGINRSYESASVPESMMKEVVPFASVMI